MGLNGFVRSVLDFGALPTFPIINKNVSTQKKRMHVLRPRREETANVRTEQRVTKLIRANLSPAVK